MFTVVMLLGYCLVSLSLLLACVCVCVYVKLLEKIQRRETKMVKVLEGKIYEEQMACILPYMHENYGKISVFLVLFHHSNL